MDRYLTNKIINTYHNNIGLHLAFSDNFIPTNNSIICYKTKLFNCIKMHQNKFYTEEYKNTYFDVIQKYNTIVHNIRFLQKKWVLYKTKKFDFDYDMGMKPLSEYSIHKTITIIQNNTSYTFTLSDLVNIYYHSIMNSEYLDEKPLQPKNPFNNIFFDDCVGYNMYVKCKLTNIDIPYFVKRYLHCNMNLKQFKAENNFKLSVNAFKNYIYYADIDDLYDELQNMFFYIEHAILHTIENDIQLLEYTEASELYKKKIVKICKHLLVPYWIHIYKTNKKEPQVDLHYVSQMMNGINRLCQTNPYFWREKVYVKRKSLFSPINKKISLFGTSINNQYIPFDFLSTLNNPFVKTN